MYTVAVINKQTQELLAYYECTTYSIEDGFIDDLYFNPEEWSIVPVNQEEAQDE